MIGGVGIMMDEEMMDRLKNIAWLANCGKPLDNDTSFTIVQAINWEQAVEHCQSDYWEAITLEAGNELTEFLCINFRDKYQQWNKVLKEGKALMDICVIPEITAYVHQRELPSIILDCVKWDVLHAIMEYYYRNEKEPAFFLELLKIYESGHFPCGWSDKDNLIVY